MEDSTTNYSTIIISVLMAVVIIATVMMPIITATTQTTTTTEIDNEGAGWLKLGYNEGADYSFNVGYETITVDEVETEIFKVGEQTGDYENMICYADPQRTLFISGDNWYLLTTGESPSVYKFTDTASVSNASGTLTINDGSTAIYSGASPTWAYIPDANGVYGFFTEGGLNLEEAKPKVAVGSYAGVFAYNDTVIAPNGYGDLGLTMSGDYAENEVIWTVAPSESDSLNLDSTDSLDSISIQPINLGGSGSVGLMAVPTPTYTDGDWGFDVINGSARIVSYSGSGGDISIPSTVSNNGRDYPVIEVGRSGNQLMDNTSISDTTLTIPVGVTKINNYAFCDVTHLIGVNFPDTLTSIGSESFRHTGLTSLDLPDGLLTLSNFSFYRSPISGMLVIPNSVTGVSDAFENCSSLTGLKLSDNLTTLRQQAFSGCSSMTGTLVIPEKIESIGSYCFNSSPFDSLINLSNTTFANNKDVFKNTIKEVLNLGDAEITTTTGGMSADSVQDHVTALGYIAPTSIHKTDIVEDTSLSATLLKLLPVFMVLTVVIFIGYAMFRPDSEFVKSLKSRF